MVTYCPGVKYESRVSRKSRSVAMACEVEATDGKSLWIIIIQAPQLIVLVGSRGQNNSLLKFIP